MGSSDYIILCQFLYEPKSKDYDIHTSSCYLRMTRFNLPNVSYRLSTINHMFHRYVQRKKRTFILYLSIFLFAHLRIFLNHLIQCSAQGILNLVNKPMMEKNSLSPTYTCQGATSVLVSRLLKNTRTSL